MQDSSHLIIIYYFMFECNKNCNISQKQKVNRKNNNNNFK
jgi:hypothetical protein